MPTVWWLPALRHLLGLGWNAGPHPWNTSLDPGPEPSQSPGANTIHSRVWSQGRSKRGVRNQVCPWEADAQPCALPRLQPWPCPHPCPHLVGAETLQGVVRELVSHVDEAVVGVDVVQTVRLGLARGLAHVLAIPEETVEVELVGILAVRGEAGVAVGKNHSPRSLAFLEPPPSLYGAPTLASTPPALWGAPQERPPPVQWDSSQRKLQIPACSPAIFFFLGGGTWMVHKGWQ